MGFRLVMLAAMGLGALYMMHILAQDYDRIRRPITKAIEKALRGKRDLNTLESNEIAELSLDWQRILNHDPFRCLQSLICQLMSGAEINDTEAQMFTQFIELTYRDAPSAVTSAYASGVAYRGVTERCYVEYPFCVYSARTMLRILRWFT